jgi:hypothetical protein
VFQPVLPLHECVNPAAAESAAEPLNSIADSTTAKALFVCASAFELLEKLADG